MQAFRRLDLGLLLAALALAGACWAFAELADEVLEDETRGVDEAVLAALRDPSDPSDAIGPEWLEEAARDVTALGSMAVLGLGVAAAAGFLAIHRRWRALVLLVAATGLGVLLVQLAKAGFERARPGVVPHLARVFSSSFPSAHSSLSAMVYLTLAVLIARLLPRRRAKAYVLLVAFALTLAVGASRVYLGVHYPTDVLAGWTLGLAWAVAFWAAARALQRRGKVERAIPPEGDG
jgi:undecaprenyl-diphosphatase